MRRRSIIAAGARTYRGEHGEISFQLERSSARRTIEIAVFPGGNVRVRAPMYTSEREIMDVVRRNGRRLSRKAAEAAQRTPAPPPTWQEGATVPLLGRRVRMVIAEDDGASTKSPSPPRRVSTHPQITITHGSIVLRPAVGTREWPPSPLWVHRHVAAWYRDTATAVFRNRVERLRRAHPEIRALGVPREISVRRMRRRWGSCFSDGRIVLNTELLSLDRNLIDYVIVHELCHLREHNHSARFYSLMDRAMPEWRTRRARLRETVTSGFLDPPTR